MLRKIILIFVLLAGGKVGFAGSPGGVNAPLTMSAQSVIGGFPSLQWVPPNAPTLTISYYNVYRSINFGGYGFLTQVSASSVTPYVFTDFSPAGCSPTVDSYIIQTFDTTPAGQDYSNTITVYIPCPPTNLSSYVSSQGIYLSWTASSLGSSFLSGYVIYRSTLSAGNYLGSPVSFVAGTSYVDSTPLAANSAYYTLAAVDSAGNISSILYNTSAIPASPVYSLGPLVTGSSGSVFLSWQASSTPGVSQYAVFRSTYASNSFASPTTICSSTSVTDTSAIGFDGQLNYYWVAPVAGNGSFGSPIALGSAIPYQAASSPTALTIQPMPFTGQMQLSWAASLSGTYNVGGYLVYSNSKLLGFTPSTSYSFNPACGVSQNFVVQAVDYAGNVSPLSLTLSASVPCPPILGGTFSGGQMSLNWAPSTPVDHSISNYLIYRGTVAGFSLPASPIATIFPPTNSYLDQPLTFSTSAYYRMYAFDSSGATSVASQEIAALAPPSVFMAAGNNRTVNLSWQAPSLINSPNIQGYTIYYGTSASGPLTITAAINSGNTNSYSLNGLKNQTTYYFQIASTSGNSQGALSSTITAMPMVLQPVFSSFNSVSYPVQSLSISWSQPPNLLSNTTVAYTLYGGVSPTGALALTFTSALSFIDSNVFSNVTATPFTYYYGLRVTDSAGDDSQFPTNFQAVTLPAAPSFIGASAGISRIDLTWTAMPLASAYKIYRSTLAAFSSPTIFPAQSANSLIDYTADNGQPYIYKVSSIINQGSLGSVESAPSLVSASALAAIPPGQPVSVNVQALSSTAANSGSNQISWLYERQGTFPITHYQILRSVNGAGFSAISTVAASPSNTLMAYSDLGLAPQNYSYQIQAFDSIGNSSMASNPVSVNLVYSLGAPSAANNVTFVSAVNGTANLVWNAPSSPSYPISIYAIYRATYSGNVFKGTPMFTAANTFSDAVSPNPASLFNYYDVVAVDVNGNSSGVYGNGIYNPAYLEIQAQLPSVSYTANTPDVPTALTALLPLYTSGSIQLSWASDPYYENVSAYNVYRGGSLLVTQPSLPGAVQTYSDTTLAYGSAVTYSVQALGLTASAISASTAPITLLPIAPFGIGYSVAPDTSGVAVTLNWVSPVAGTDVSAFKVYRSTTGSFAPLGTYFQATATGGSYVDHNLPAGPVYYYEMSAVSLTVEGPVSQAISITVASPAPAYNLSVSPLAGGGSVQFVWSYSLPATAFSIYRATYPISEPLGGAQSIATVNSNTFNAYTYTDGNAPDSSAFYYGVAAYSGNERGAVTSTTQAITPLPGIVNGLAALPGFSAGLAYVQLSWNALAGNQSATAYTVYRATYANVGAGTALTTTSNINFTDFNPLTATALYYGVVGLNLLAGQISSPVSVTAYNQATAPTALTGVAGSGSVLLSWGSLAASQGATAYNIYRALSGSTLAYISTTATTNYLDSQGLMNGQPYLYAVAGLNSAGQGTTATVLVTPAFTDAPVPPPAFNLQTGFVGANEVQLNWQTSAGSDPVSLYQIYRATYPLNPSIASGGPSSAAYLLTTVTASGAITFTATLTYPDAANLSDQNTYYYAVTALDGRKLESIPAFASIQPYRLPGYVQSPLSKAGVNRVDLAWAGPTDTGTAGLYSTAPYRVYRVTYPTNNVSLEFNLGFANPANLSLLLTQTASTQFSDLNAPPLPSPSYYTYYVSTVDANQKETYNATKFTGLNTGAPPNIPQRLTALAGDGQVTLLWVVNYLQGQGDLINNGRYNIYRASVASSSSPFGGVFGGPYQDNQQVKVSQQSVNFVTANYTDGNAANLTNYYYAIGPVNDFGENAASQFLQVTPYRPLRVPPAPNDVINASLINKSQVQLIWQAAPNSGNAYTALFDPNQSYQPIGYHVYRSIDDGNSYGTGPVATLLSTTTTSYVDSNTTFGTYYTYRVTPLDAQYHDGQSYQTVKIQVPPPVNNLLLDHNAINPEKGQRLGIRFSQVQSGHLWIKIFTLAGEYIGTVTEMDVPPGASSQNPYISDTYYWDGHNANGQEVASGVYIVHLEGPQNKTNAKVAVIK